MKFSFKTDEAKSIEILGLNNSWQEAVVMNKKKDGSFSAEINLPKKSRHEFKYLVNKIQWLNDPDADGEVPNSFGGTNSLVVL